MDQQEQKDGERCVRERLIDELTLRGLGRPTGLTVKAFDDMLRGLCQKLAHMTPENLDALAEVAAAKPSGKDRDRFPIANDILEWAREIQPPKDTGSPLVRALFLHAVGRGMVAEGFGPELLRWVKKHRRWPKDGDIRLVRAEGVEAVGRIQLIEDRQRRGVVVDQADTRFLEARRRAEQKCQDLTNGVYDDAA